ncbi:hypothetical protein ABZY93_24755 [Streptomyces smyrnaeus]
MAEPDDDAAAPVAESYARWHSTQVFRGQRPAAGSPPGGTSRR